MSSYNNPINQTLPTPGENRATEETDVRNYLTYWQNFLKTTFENSNRTTGGAGFDSDNLADNAVKSNNIGVKEVKTSNIDDSAVRANNLKPKFKKVGTTLNSNATFGANGIVVATCIVTTTFTDSYVKLNATSVFEPTAPSGLANLVIERSSTSDFASFTRVGITYQGQVKFDFAFCTLHCFGYDTIATPGTYYYRARMSLERVGATAASPTSGATLIIGDSQRQHYITYEISQVPLD